MLRDCIGYSGVGELSSDFGLTIDNGSPEVMLPEVQAGLDRIVQLRLETEQARQDELKASAQAQAEQARQEGEIRVAQSRIQEEARQQLTLAQLNKEKIQAQKAADRSRTPVELGRAEAERAIIEAEKSNELLAAQSDLEIRRAAALAAAQQAKADTAMESARPPFWRPTQDCCSSRPSRPIARRSLPISLSLRRMAPRRPLSCPVLGSSQRWTLGTAATLPNRTNGTGNRESHDQITSGTANHFPG